MQSFLNRVIRGLVLDKNYTTRDMKGTATMTDLRSRAHEQAPMPEGAIIPTLAVILGDPTVSKYTVTGP